jgi:cytoskeletal protein RodZ
MAKSTFGEHLKREREMRGVSLQEISTATRISTRFLDALENEQWDRLPGGVFNRGFVRAVAHFLGLDEEALIAEYAMTTNDQPEVAVWADKVPPRARHRWRKCVAVVLLLASAATLGWAYWENRSLIEAWRKPAPVAPAPAPPTAPEATRAASANPPANVTPVPAGEMLELKVDAGRETLLTVIVDGKKEFDGRLPAGEQRRFRARERLEISGANSSALLLELNGFTVPPLGPPGQPGQLTLTHQDLKKLRGGQN